MRYLIYAIIAWECVWLVIFSYAIWDGALQTARDKGELASVLRFIGAIVIVMPLAACGAGLLIRRLVHRPCR